MYRAATVVCSAIHKRAPNTLCGQNVEFLNVKIDDMAYKVANGLRRVKGISTD
jgi:hypothetical protein